MKVYYLFLVVFFLSCTTQVFANEELVLNSGNIEPYLSDANDGFYDLLVKELFLRLNVDASVVGLPAERSLINANSGIDNGVIARVGGLEKQYPNLIRVSEKVIDFEFIVYTRDVDFEVDGWESLKPYDVGIIKGWKILEKNIVCTKSLTNTRSPNQLFEMVGNGRIDVAVYERWGGFCG